ncbi:metalloregulator ArsR/SmtB family transcription factor [Rubrimonas cliftonensis]
MMQDPSDLFAALGQTHRLAIFRLLARRAPEGVPAGEIATAVGLRPNNASAHLAHLARAGLIRGERDGKLIRYRLDLAATGGLIDYLALDCCRGRPDLCAAAARRLHAPGEDVMSDKSYTVLFICSGNSARSIFAEAILSREGAGRFVAHSAGTRPRSELNPFAIAQLEKLGHDVSGLRAKHVSEFQGPGAPHFDFAFTVCDNAANEDCAPWAGQTITGHWGVPDPVAATGTEAERAVAFAEAYRMLKHRIGAFVNLSFDKLDRIALQKAVDDIGGAQAVPVA